MNNLTKRTITGLTLAIVIFIAVSIGIYGFLLLVFSINVLSLLEFYRLFTSDVIQPRKIIGAIFSLCILLTGFLFINGWVSWKILLINIPVTFSIFVIELYLKATHPFTNLAYTFLGILYITIPLFFFGAIPVLTNSVGLYNYKIILGYFFILWADDTGAYFTGKYLGRHHLFERISPKKTWEGSLGGMVCAVIISLLNSRLFPVMPFFNWLLMTFIIVICGTFGDLIKSMLKRSLAIKDSGTILPGHGGMLDRFDSLLGSAPFVFTWLMLYRSE